MIILEILGWLVFSCMLMSFIEHQVHLRLMHTKSLKKFQRTYEAHAIEHHGHYSKIFSDDPVPKGEDKEIQLTVRKAPIKAIPFAIVMSLFSWYAGLIFIGVVVFHHWAWNKIHLEMHKPENKGFSKWPIYKFLQQYHCLHHKYPLKNLNVVFPFADYVLGTSVRMTAADRIWLDKMLAPAAVAVHTPERELVTSDRKS
jgi:hypothetical protein